MRKKALCIPTARLRLAGIREEDAETLMDLLAHPEVGKTYMVPEFSCREEARKLSDTFRRLSRDPDRFVYGIFREEKLVGFLNEVEKGNGEIELGLVIDPACKNRGYGTEALGAAMEELLCMGHRVVKTGAFAENAPSIRVMEKCGMTRLPQTEEVEYRGQRHCCVWFEKRK